VELGALRFRQRRVGGVSDEDVMETEVTLTLPLRSEQALANAGQEMRVEVARLLLSEQLQDELPRELGAGYSGALQHLELARLESVEAAGQQRVE
jgi:hypothetical protein